MENGRIKIWFPAVRTGSGTDVFTRRLAEAFERQGIKTAVTWFPLRYEPMPFLLRNVRPPPGTDIVFANSWNGFAFKRTDIPLIVTMHHSGFEPAIHSYRTPSQRIYHRLLIEPFEKRSFQAADVVTAVSMFAAENMKRIVDLENVEVIYNWIDIDLFHPAPEVQEEKNRPFRLLFVGKPSLSKGADLLAPIMRQLGSDFVLRIAGRPDPAQAGGYPANIQVLGWLHEKELINAYQECDALLFPSRSEGFGYAALEAMACGKPVIATDATALPEVVTDGVTGILCPVGDVSAFVGACRRLAANPMHCGEMGKAARQRVIEQFSETMIIDRYLRLMRGLLTPSQAH